ncbi:MAG: hypothetical protein ACP5GK_06910 [Desulfurella sp.]|uniref:hypothetical protein n=1 Tax=Desulfurella sp. TaxID=1962857 RepID=UPI000CB19B52|nr:hypothetical protein [Desulfurella sp.]PMP90981.1 MAG: hypothetical protein C0173_03940 [Desulfurella sp.]HEX14019.1 hypothetical protein [Desulfurella acetivorans]
MAIKGKDLPDIAFKLWSTICLKLFLVLIISIFIFFKAAYYINEIWLFVTIFLIFILFSIIVIYKEFKKLSLKNEYFKHVLPSYSFIGLNPLLIYLSLTWRALLLLIPLISIVVFFSQGSIIGRIIVIILEFLVGYPSIYWYLKSKTKLG